MSGRAPAQGSGGWEAAESVLFPRGASGSRLTTWERFPRGEEVRAGLGLPAGNATGLLLRPRAEGARRQREGGWRQPLVTQGSDPGNPSGAIIHFPAEGAERRLKENLTLSPVPVTAGKPAADRWQWGQQGCAVTLISCCGPWSEGRVSSALGGAQSIGARLCAGLDLAAAPLGPCIISIIPLPPLQMGEGVGSEPFMAALAMRVASRTCREGKKQCRLSPRHPIYHQPKYAVSSGNWVLFPIPLKVHFKMNQT